MSDMTDEQIKEMNKKFPSIRTPAHPFYKLGVLAEEHGMHDLLMALSEYCGRKVEEAMAIDDDALIFEWGVMDHMIGAIAHQAWVLFDAAKEEEAEQAAKQAAEKAAHPNLYPDTPKTKQ